jgi:hypothetical protein
MSIVSVQHRPYVWNPSYTDLVWQCLSDKTPQLDMKYVFDVYVNGQFVNRIKQRPNPAGYGLINLGQYAAGYLDPSVGLLEDPQNSNYQWGTGSTIGGEIYVLAGEEYRGATGGVLTIYNGVGNTAGTPAFRLAARGDGIVLATGNTGTSVRFHAGYKDAVQTYEFEANPTLTDYPYSMKPATGHTGLYRSHAVTGTNNLRSNVVTSDDRHTLTFWNRTDGTGTRWYVYAAQFSFFYGGTAVPYGTDEVYNDLASGGGPWAGCNVNVGTTASYVYNVGQIACGPADVTNFIGAIAPGTDRYTVQLFAAPATGITGPNCNLGLPLSEPMEFVIDDCNPSGFGRWRFSWLNNLGGRDWFNFTLRNTEKYSSKVETYFKEPRYNSAGIYGANTLSPATYGDSVSNKTIEKTYTAMTDWITEEQSEFLKGLFNSPHVLGYDPDNGGPYLVTIKSTSYEVQTYARQKMFNYEIEFTAGQPINTQYI